MATVDGITVAKAQQIADASVISGAINPTTGHLILTTGGGTTIDAGLADAADVAHLTKTETLSGKTLLVPIIGSFVNAQHNHSDAAGGGLIPIGALPIGTADAPAPVTSLISRDLSDADTGVARNMATLTVPPGRWLILASCEGVTLAAGGTNTRFGFDIDSDVPSLQAKRVTSSSDSPSMQGGRSMIGWLGNSAQAHVNFNITKLGSGALITSSTTGMLVAVRLG